MLSTTTAGDGACCVLKTEKPASQSVTIRHSGLRWSDREAEFRYGRAVFHASTSRSERATLQQAKAIPFSLRRCCFSNSAFSESVPVKLTSQSAQLPVRQAYSISIPWASASSRRVRVSSVSTVLSLLMKWTRCRGSDSVSGFETRLPPPATRLDPKLSL